MNSTFTEVAILSLATTSWSGFLYQLPAVPHGKESGV